MGASRQVLRRGSNRSVGGAKHHAPPVLDREQKQRMWLIDKKGARPVCVACRKLGPYQEVAPGAFICDACVQAAERHLRDLMETVPELRDHRLKRWRKNCDCPRCLQRGNRAV